jgi:hypothetical protein
MPQFTLHATISEDAEVTVTFTEEDVEETVYKMEDFLLACGFRIAGELGIQEPSTPEERGYWGKGDRCSSSPVDPDRGYRESWPAWATSDAPGR